MADFPLRVVDGRTLDEEYRRVLRPGELMRDRRGNLRRLPRFFYRIESWDQALETALSPNFEVWEFINVDVREHERVRTDWPRYTPCAVSLLAAHLELFREAVDTYVHVAANGGYRSPAHRLSTHASPHCWGTAVNVYRIGDDWLDGEKTLAKYARVARRVMPAVYVRPFGGRVGEADDHLHLDLGYTLMVPGSAPGEDEGGEAASLPEDGTDVTETAEVEA